MMFKPRCKDKVVADEFPPFSIGSQKLMYVEKFKYLGHIINNRLNDNDDICREIKNLFTRCNMLITRFNKCSVTVKCVLFRTYCLCMYNIGLWKHYNITVINKFRSAYHNGIIM